MFPVFIDPEVYELLGFKGIAAVFLFPLVVTFIAVLIWLPAGAIPFFLAAIAVTTAGIWVGMRNFEDWFYAPGEGPE